MRCSAPTIALLAALAACASPDYGPRRTELPPDGGAVIPCRHSRGTFLVFAEFADVPGRHALLFDTGTDRTLLDLEFARRLGLTTVAEEAVVTATGASVAGYELSRLPWLRLGEVRFHDVDAVGLDLSRLREHGGLPIVGIAGCDLFRQCLLEVDYRTRGMRVLPRSAAPRTGGHAFEERSPWVTLDLAGSPVRTLVDTGFQQSLALPPGTNVPFAHEPRPYGEIASIAGTEPKELTRLDGLARLGDLVWTEPSILVVPGCPKFGARLLRDCVLRLDARAGRIWIDRSR